MLVPSSDTSGAHRSKGDRHLKKIYFAKLSFKEVPDQFTIGIFSQSFQVLLSKPAVKWDCWVNSLFSLLLYTVFLQSLPSEQAQGGGERSSGRKSPTDPTDSPPQTTWVSSQVRLLSPPEIADALQQYCLLCWDPLGDAGLVEEESQTAFSHISWGQPFRCPAFPAHLHSAEAWASCNWFQRLGLVIFNTS